MSIFFAAGQGYLVHRINLLICGMHNDPDMLGLDHLVFRSWFACFVSHFSLDSLVFLGFYILVPFILRCWFSQFATFFVTWSF